MLSQKYVMFVKEEATYGLDPTPTESANAILCIDPEIKEIVEPIERNLKGKFLGILGASLAGQRYVEISFKVEIRGSGYVALGPRLSDLLESCAMDEAIVSGASAAYETVSESHKSCTIWVYIDGKRHVVNGCRGNVKLTATPGQLGMLEFSMKGLYIKPTVTALPSPTYETTVPPVSRSCAFTYNSKTTLIAKSVEIDLGNILAIRPNLNASTCIAGFEITNRKPILTFEVEAQIQTSYDFRGDMLTTTRALSFVIGQTAGNICTVTIPKLNITNVEYSDSEGLLIEKLTAECCESSGDDSVKLTFT